jgi:hypothetical protein
MAGSPERHDAYSEIEAQAHMEGVSPDQFVAHRLGLAVLREAEEYEDEEFGSGNIVLLEITGGKNPSVIARALVETMDEVPSHAALVKRVKRIPDSSTLYAYELPTVEKNDFEAEDGLLEEMSIEEAIGPHPVFSRSTMSWVNGSRKR